MSTGTITKAVCFIVRSPAGLESKRVAPEDRQVSLTLGVVTRGDNARLKLCVASLAILHREQCALFS